MRKKNVFAGIGSCVGMLVLILDGRTALEGAAQGLELCLKTVIPSLFPFFVLSTMLTSALAGEHLPLLRPIGWLCGIPSGGEALLISGFLGGYPVGAQSVAAAFRSGQLTRNQAERLLSFCNNAGPAFLFGMVSALFPARWMARALWGIHIAGAVLTACLIPPDEEARMDPMPSAPLSLVSALRDSLRIMATVCGWVVLFRVGIAFLNRWVLTMLPVPARVAVTGLLELSNGCCCLTEVSDLTVRFLLCAGMLSFGGLCVTMQTVSVTTGLSLRGYFTGKLIQTAFSLLFSAAVMAGYGPASCLFLIFAILLLKLRKKSSIRKVLGV